MTSDFINRDKAANVLCMACGNAACDPFECSFYKEMEGIPAADVRPVVRGNWEKHEDFDAYGGGRFVEWVCSECDKRHRGDWVIRNSHIEETPTENYCPNCGADMRRKTDSSLRSE